MKKELMSTVLDLRGLDMVTPVDLLSDGRTPFAKNFRLYAQQSDDRRVAVSSRRGPSYYTETIGEEISVENDDVTGADAVKIGIIDNVYIQPFEADNSDRISRVDLRLSNPDENASGNLLVEIYEDRAGTVGRLLGTSSISSGSVDVAPEWLTARFINAPQLVNNDPYYLVVRMQDDAREGMYISTTTIGELALKTNSALVSGTEQLFSLNFRVFTAPGAKTKGAYRFARNDGDNLTVAAYDDSLYRVDDATGDYDTIISGLNSLATQYSFANGDNKLFFVNGYDNLMTWNGDLESDAANSVANPGFETNTTGWAATGGGTGNAITRSTAQFNTGVASLSVTATGAVVHSARYTLALTKFKRYKITYWVKGAAATGTSTVFAVGPNATVNSVPMTTAWQQVSFYYIPTAAVTAIDFRGSLDNFFLDDVSITDTGIEVITDNELPILSQIVMHKDRLFGVDASDKNKIVFSENPGNPAYDPTGVIPTTAIEQWYYAWLSVSVIYAPRPYEGSPITKLESFQDNLTIFTQDNKYILSGYDRGSFYLRQSTGSKGAISMRGAASDENNIFFVANDGFYRYNGSSDEKISDLVLPLIDGCPRLQDISVVPWKNQIRFYMASQSSSVNDTCLIYDKNLEEMLYDTDTFVETALYYTDADDQQQIAEFSSVLPTAYYGETVYNSLGAPIDFEYRFKYDSMKTPMQKKRIKRFFPILQGVDSTFKISLAMDKDFEDSPRIKEQLLTTNGARIGDFTLGDGTILGGDKSFKPTRQSYSGYAYYWQLRVKRKGVNNRVGLIGAQFTYKTKRL